MKVKQFYVTRARNRRKFFLIAFFSLSAAICHAQEKSQKTRRIGLSLLGNAIRFKDRTISRRTYNGASIGLSLSLLQEKPSAFWFVNATAEKGFYTPEGFFDFAKRCIEHDEVRTELGYLIWASARARWVFLAGGILSGKVQQDEIDGFSNSKIILNATLDLGPAVAARTAFRMLHRDWQFDALLSSPLLGYLLRPQYGLPSFYRLSHMGFYTLNRFFQLRAKSSLTYALFPKGSLSLSYEWAYQTSRVPNPLQGVAHRIAIGFFIHI